MTLGARTPRDQLDRVLALVKRSFRYVWVTALVTVLGAAISIGFALMRPRSYVSQTVFLHREVIPSNLLGGDAAGNARNMGIRFREMVLASPLLDKVIKKFDLYAKTVKESGNNAAIEELRKAITFRTSGHGTFSIAFKGDTPEEAQKVTEYLASLLIDWEREIQLESVSVTKKFLDDERSKVVADLNEREKSLAEFLAKHPEFAQETAATGQNVTGAAIRARKRGGSKVDPQLLALQRQRNRIQARLSAKPDAPPEPAAPPSTPEQIQARQEVDSARDELNRAKRDLDDVKARFTELHPDVVAAKRRVEAAESRLKRAQAAVIAAASPAERPALQPVSAKERGELQAELSRLEREIRRYRSDKSESPERDTKANQVVELETEWNRLNREVNEMRERYEGIESKAYTAEVVAASELARQGSQLSVIEPASKPTRPAGAPRSVVVMAGTFLFGCLGVLVALGLALLDDRIVGRYDIERLEIVPVLVVVPRVGGEAKRGKKGKTGLEVAQRRG